MQFEHGHFLNWLWAMPILAGVFYWVWRRHQALIKQFVDHKLMATIAGSFHAKKLAAKYALLVGVVVFSVVALARPQWGFEWQEVKREAMDILVLIDTSKSMLTQDVKPNRLERTKLAVKDLLQKLKGDRIGLMAFAGEAFLVCPLTVDYNGFLLSLNDINTNTIPRGGTNVSRAIQEAMENYDETPNEFKAIIIVTDGDNLEGDPLFVAKKAEEQGIKIYTIGIGTKEGELIQVRNIVGESEFLKDQQGNFVKSRLNEKLLKEVALTTGGVYVKSSGAQFGLDYIYEHELSKYKKRELETKMEKKYFQRFQIPLTLAFVLLMVETCVTTRRKEKNM